MFSEPNSTIRLSGVSKAYRIYSRPVDRLKQMFVEAGKRLVPDRLLPTYGKEHWALRGIDLEIGRGETVGVIGPNGAGKSTLLQIVCGTVRPTTGEVEVSGRIAALLELGSGFNPEFTGRENVYLNGAVLGLSRAEIASRFDEIAGFADIGQFLDQPVKTYSSGMYARLAFSVAVCVEPDILIVDEALSVGDGWFQHKSMARMRRLMEGGATVLFVSHSIDAVRSICSRALWIESGRVKMAGASSYVTNAYMNEIFLEYNRIAALKREDDSAAGEGEESVAVGAQPASGLVSPDRVVALDCAEPADEVVPVEPDDQPLPVTSEGALKLLCVHVLDGDGVPTDRLHQGENFTIRAEIEVLRNLSDLSVGILIKDRYGLDLTGESIFNKYRRGVSRAAGSRLSVSFGAKMVLRGGEGYSVALRVNQVTRWDRSDNILIFNDDTAAVFKVVLNPDEPMWFKFKQDIDVHVDD